MPLQDFPRRRQGGGGRSVAVSSLESLLESRGAAPRQHLVEAQVELEPAGTQTENTHMEHGIQVTRGRQPKRPAAKLQDGEVQVTPDSDGLSEHISRKNNTVYFSFFLIFFFAALASIGVHFRNQFKKEEIPQEPPPTVMQKLWNYFSEFAHKCRYCSQHRGH